MTTGVEPEARIKRSEQVPVLGRPEAVIPAVPAYEASPTLNFDYGDQGQRVNLRRDQLFRHLLLAADTSAFVVALIILSNWTSRSLRLTVVGVIGLLCLFLVSKIAGLYDRDEALLHKTTLDEAPTLFQVATLGVLCVWLSGEFIFAGGNLDRGEALALWLMLIVFLVLARAGAREVALRLSPAERCLFVGNDDTAATIESKLEGYRGLKAELVAHIDPADVSVWSTDRLSAARLSGIRDLARSLDVQRAIVAPDCLEPQRMLDLVSTLEAVGVKVSVLPRLLEVVGVVGGVRRPARGDGHGGEALCP